MAAQREIQREKNQMEIMIFMEKCETEKVINKCDNFEHVRSNIVVDKKPKRITHNSALLSLDFTLKCIHFTVFFSKMGKKRYFYYLLMSIIQKCRDSEPRFQ
jgi:hypothetical protein